MRPTRPAQYQEIQAPDPTPYKMLPRTGEVPPTEQRFYGDITEMDNIVEMLVTLDGDQVQDASLNLELFTERVSRVVERAQNEAREAPTGGLSARTIVDYANALTGMKTALRGVGDRPGGEMFVHYALDLSEAHARLMTLLVIQERSTAEVMSSEANIGDITGQTGADANAAAQVM